MELKPPNNSSLLDDATEDALQSVRALCGTLSMVAGIGLAISCKCASQRTFDRQRKMMLHIVQHIAIFDVFYGASFLASWFPLREVEDDKAQPVLIVVCDVALLGWSLGSMSGVYTAVLA